jgi:hypothetical protein
LDGNEYDETLANSIKQSTQEGEKRRNAEKANSIKQSTQEGEKKRNAEKGPKSKPKELNPKWVMFQNPH